MQNPKEEITDVVHKLTSTDSPNVQKDTLLKYFTSDASFNHPLCCVKSGDNSREAILGVYQWYRIMSPVIQIHVDKVVFDETGNVLHLDMVQTFHIFISLFRPAPARLLTRLQLYHDTDSGLYFIKDQTDFYQPEEIANLVIPPLAILINLFKYIAGLFSGFLAWIFHTLFGWWKPGPNSKEMKQKKM